MTTWIYDDTGALLEEIPGAYPMQYERADGRSFTVKAHSHGEAYHLWIIRTPAAETWVRWHESPQGPVLDRAAVPDVPGSGTLGSIEKDYTFLSNMTAPPGGWTAHVDRSIASTDGAE